MGYKILAGRYEIHEKIGDGGMAVVYKARDKLLNRMVAIKILRPEYVKDTTFVENFRRESMAAASLDTHPNIVTIYDVGKDGNIYYIVMELVDGKPLSDIIAERGPLDYHEVTHLGIQIASALGFAHKNNIIHRDIKPHNILVSGEGDNEVAKITDFGIARAVTDRTTVNDSNVIMGSVHYFSPEQGRGQYVDEKSDIYSLGIVLYEMLTGKVPFDADNPVTVAIMHMNDPIVPPSRIVKVVPPGLEQIILKATEKYQVNRFKSVDDMLEALKNVSFITGTFTDERIQSIFQKTDSEKTSAPPVQTKAGQRYGDDDGLFAALPDDGAQDDANGAYDDDYEDDDEPDEDEDERRGLFGALFGRNRDREKPVSKSAQKTGTGGKTFTNNKKTVIIAAVLAVALALLLAFGAIKIINLAAGDSKVTVPDVLGMTEEEAETALNKVGLKMELDEDGVYSDQYEEDLVAAQDPRAKLKAKKKSVVHVTLSLGSDNIEDLIAKLKELGVEIPANADRETLLKLIEEAESKIEIPDLNGKSQASAEYTASALGFKIGNVKYEDSDKPVDTVIAQSPSPGDIAKKGTKIDITLSQGPRSKEVDMPNLIKMSEADAKAKIEELHLVVGTVETKYSADYAKGTVMWQQFQIGAKLTEGQTVNIIVSLGPEEKESTVKIDVDFSGAPADSFKLSALQISPDGSQNYILRNQDRLQSQGSEIISATGKGAGWKVIVYFNDIQAKIYNIDFNTGKVS